MIEVTIKHITGREEKVLSSTYFKSHPKELDLFHKSQRSRMMSGILNCIGVWMVLKILFAMCSGTSVSHRLKSSLGNS